MVLVVGIDVAKASLAVTLVVPAGKARRKRCANTPVGHTELLHWLRRQAEGPVHVGLEATGGYQDAVALALYDAGHTVSVLNPASVEAYGRSQLRRAKTNPTDAALIADYIRTQTPPAWTPAPPEMRELQALVRRLDALLEMRTQERNRLDPAATIVQPSIADMLEHLDAAITAIKSQIAAHIDRCPTLREPRDLNVSIPGIGATTAAILLGDMLQVTRFPSARQLAAFSGLFPHIRHSGTSIRGRGTLSKLGAGRLRKALFFPALVAMRYTPSFARSPGASAPPASYAW